MLETDTLPRDDLAFIYIYIYSPYPPDLYLDKQTVLFQANHPDRSVTLPSEWNKKRLDRSVQQSQ